ncbi:unnamed protein product [Moneuplotes crassus]|uniref:Uncharacterized protein n=1 Tax=Euplotes crassus TaxID=5936 RepID=A0AAD1XEA8_EUPCR|nr:unnamed protein product [Moneuplotes crassus]
MYFTSVEPHPKRREISLYPSVQHYKQPMLQPVFQDQEATPVVKTQESLTENQLKSIQKSLAQKKEAVDHEVKKTAGLFERVNKFYHIFVKVKALMLMVFSIYHFLGGSDEPQLLPIILSFSMSLILFKKSMASKKAIKSNHHLTVKKIFKKAITLGIIFSVVYLLWSVAIFKSFKTPEKSTDLKAQAIKASLTESADNIQISIPNLSHARIGAPAAHFGNKFDRKQFENTVLTKEVNKDLTKQRLKEKLVFSPSISRETTLYIFFAAMTILIGLKFSMYFSHFNQYKNALEKQDKINNLILHFQNTEISGRAKIAPEPVEIVEEAPVGSDYPIIEEEPVRLASVTDCSIDSNRIIDITEDPCYPVISELPLQNKYAQE